MVNTTARRRKRKILMPRVQDDGDPEFVEVEQDYRADLVFDEHETKTWSVYKDLGTYIRQDYDECRGEPVVDDTCIKCNSMEVREGLYRHESEEIAVAKLKLMGWERKRIFVKKPGYDKLTYNEYIDAGHKVSNVDTWTHSAMQKQGYWVHVAGNGHCYLRRDQQVLYCYECIATRLARTCDTGTHAHVRGGSPTSEGFYSKTMRHSELTNRDVLLEYKRLKAAAGAKLSNWLGERGYAYTYFD